jgi:uncharacterized protein (TIGR03435 family)
MTNRIQRIYILGAIGFAVSAAFGQTADGPPEFEVVSVKPANPRAAGRVKMKEDPGTIEMLNVTLRDYISQAYDVEDYQIFGPDWLGSDRYDIVARFMPGTSKERLLLMWQKLLADRFKLVLHREKKVMPVYALVVAKSGLKIHKAEEGANMTRIGRGHMVLRRVSLSLLAEILSSQMDHPVLDQTDAEGLFDITLDWVPDDTQAKMGMAGGDRPSGMLANAPDGLSIFDALQEKLGLNLKTKKEAVEILVVDHAERVPTEN